jgi:hypothetical protein
MLIVGIVLLLAAGGMVWMSFNEKKKMAMMESTETNTVDYLKELAQSMGEGVGSGALDYLTEVKGQVVCDRPLISELNETECVYYSMSVKRKYEETYYEENEDGQRERRTRTGSDTVASNRRNARFMVEDATGRIQVVPDGAKFIAEKVLSRFEPGSGGEIRFGSFAFTPHFQEGDRRTLGYQFEEEAIPVGRNIYIHGRATDKQGELCIESPAEKGQFIISVKSEEELARKGKSMAIGMTVGAVIAAIAGVVLIIMGVMK